MCEYWSVNHNVYFLILSFYYLILIGAFQKTKLDRHVNGVQLRYFPFLDPDLKSHKVTAKLYMEIQSLFTNFSPEDSIELPT